MDFGSGRSFFVSMLAGASLVFCFNAMEFNKLPALGSFTEVRRLGNDHELPKQCMEVGLSRQRHRPVPSQAEECLLYDIPSDYMEMVTNILVGIPSAGACVKQNGCLPPHLPYDPFSRRFGLDWPPYGYSMIGRERMDNFRSAIAEVNRNNIPGAIIETGVWRGGAMLMAAAALKEAGIKRDLYLFDAFESIGNYGNYANYIRVEQKQVEEAFEYFKVNSDRVHIVKGLFQDTVPLWTNRKDPIAVLRVDSNFYDSYQDVMYAMYENVPVGGIVIFDDIVSHDSVQRFWRDFKIDHGIVEDFNKIDDHSAWFRKTNNIDIDQSKKRPPQDVNKRIQIK